MLDESDKVSWSKDLAYVIGLLATDGNLSKDGRHISLTSKDYEQILNLSKVLNLKNKISVKNSSYSNKGKYYFVQFSNVRFYHFLERVGVHPNKSNTIGEMLVPNKYFSDFLRGCLDGDGHTYSYWDRRWKSSFMLYTGFASASFKHLCWIRNKIERLYGVEGRIKSAGKNTYQLVYAKKSSIKLLAKIYKDRKAICLSRKKFKIEEALGIIRTLSRDAETGRQAILRR